jgi:hypothetical protein
MRHAIGPSRVADALTRTTATSSLLIVATCDHCTPTRGPGRTSRSPGASALEAPAPRLDRGGLRGRARVAKGQAHRLTAPTAHRGGPKPRRPRTAWRGDPIATETTRALPVVLAVPRDAGWWQPSDTTAPGNREAQPETPAPGHPTHTQPKRPKPTDQPGRAKAETCGIPGRRACQSEPPSGERTSEARLYGRAMPDVAARPAPQES